MEIVTILKSKWFLIISITLIVLVVLFIAGRKSVHSEILIRAQANEVWSVLMDKEVYGEWNSVLIPIEGELVEGTKVVYEFYQDENTKSVLSSKVKRLVENELLNQAGGIPGILTFNHRYILEKSDQGTNVIIHEDYRGIMVSFWNPTPVQKAYAKLNKELKRRVEYLKEK